LITEAVQVLNYKAEPKNIKLEKSIPEIPIISVIDGSRISRVVQNLIANAIKFSQKQGIVIIQLSENENAIIIKVEDFGIGMDEKTKKLAFDSFTSVGRTGTSGEKSYGLGLSICKKLIELHDGKLWVTSIQGKGSSFYIEIPRLKNS
jgi:signal transduction histidine kinase